MLSFLVRTAIRKGLLGGSNRWLAVGIAAGGFRWILRRAKRDEEVVAREELQPGQTLVVDHTGTLHRDLPRRAR